MVCSIMKIRSIATILIISFAGLFAPLSAQYEEKTGYQPKVQIGGWFGVVSPFPGTELAQVLKSYIGGGAFARVNLPIKFIYLESGISVQNYSSFLTEKLTLAPFYGALALRVPLDFALHIYLKAGGGASYVKVLPENKSNILPSAFFGIETTFPATSKVNIGFRVDYNIAYEKQLTPPAGIPNYTLVNGHFLTFGLLIHFNLNED